MFMSFVGSLTFFGSSVLRDRILAALISFIICKEQVRELAQLHKSKARIPTMGRLIISSLVSTNIHLLFVLAKLY